MKMASTEYKSIKIVSRVNAQTGLMAAFSDDLQGLLVVGRNAQEIESKLPDAIKEILEANGIRVLNLHLQSDADEKLSWDGGPSFRAQADLAA